MPATESGAAAPVASACLATMHRDPSRPVRTRFRSLRRGLRWSVLCLVCLLGSACNSPNGAPSLPFTPRMVMTDTQPYADAWLPLDSAVGQTFVSNDAGLRAVEFYLAPNAGAGLSGDEILTLRLRMASDAVGADSATVATATLPARAVTAPGFYRFPIAASAGTRPAAFHAELTSSVPGIVLVGRAAGPLYQNGALTIDGIAQDAQLAFRLGYAPLWLARNFITWMLRALLLVLLALLIYVAPGLAVLLLVERSHPNRLTAHWAERMAVAAGIGLALYPLLMVWTHRFGLALGPLYVWLPVGLGVAGCVWGMRWATNAQPAASSQYLANGALLMVMVLVLAARLLAVRDLVAPMWGDAVHHTAITQLILDHDGLFDSWRPYAPYDSFSVHFGFAALAAVFHWTVQPWLTLAGMDSVATDSAYSVLLAGQLINGLAVLAIYPLAVRVAGGRRWAGVGAVLVAGLLSTMPGMYVNWGRYAQLAGQAILPVALWLLWRTAERSARASTLRRIDWSIALLAGGVLASMALTYYRMPFYYVVFVAAWLIGWALPQWRLDWRSWTRALFALSISAVTAVLLFAPWLLQVANSPLAETASTATSETVKLKWLLVDFQDWRTLPDHVAPYLLVLAGVALIWALWRRAWPALCIGVWIIGLPAYKAGQLVALPGAHMLQSFAIIIALYIPISLLIGWLLAQLVETQPHRPSAYSALAVLAIGATLWGFVGQARMVQPQHVLVTAPDRRAMQWIDQNVPPDATFLVEGYPISGGVTSTVGSDAGWWIPLYTRRANTVPPQYAMLNETPHPPDYTARMVALVGDLAQTPLSSPDAIDILCQNGITHVYVGQAQGSVGYGAQPLFVPADLHANPALAPIYRRDRVRIFALEPDACPINRSTQT